ncbi:ribonuclease P protein component [Candidatus Saccharibacteria bacterium TM7i]|nr:ribonuclease P protein component [Candidatus Saccharibacteria bacterium TM7i]
MIAGKFRFHGHGSLRYVYANGKAARSHYATVKYVQNSRRKFSRFSVVISKKVLKSAVGRNRVRRRIYEYVRTNMHRMTDIYDVVIICTSSELRSMPYDQFTEQLEQLFEKSELFPVTQAADKTVEY